MGGRRVQYRRGDRPDRARRALQPGGHEADAALCCVLAISGAAMYSLASFAFEHVSAPAAPYIVFVGRLLQGIARGQQAVEQSA